MAREVQLHLLREAVAEEGAPDGRGAALSTDGAMAAPSGIKQLVDASSARLEASIDELALRIARNGAGAASGPSHSCASPRNGRHAARARAGEELDTLTQDEGETERVHVGEAVACSADNCDQARRRAST